MRHRATQAPGGVNVVPAHGGALSLNRTERRGDVVIDKRVFKKTLTNDELARVGKLSAEYKTLKNGKQIDRRDEILSEVMNIFCCARKTAQDIMRFGTYADYLRYRRERDAIRRSGGRQSGRHYEKIADLDVITDLSGIDVKPKNTSNARWRIEQKRRMLVRKFGSMVVDALPDPDLL